MHANRKFSSRSSSAARASDKREQSSYDDFVPAAAVPSQYYMDQIHLDKMSEAEVQEALRKQEQTQSAEEALPPLEPCHSEYQLQSLNRQLSALPMVVAFNEMEKRKKKE
ncbi:hypothetical protein Q1695_005298 [Nippostrongylus brasiliensis]|nr:hypothetical protein Q1695_005298 [Nippostrongylus brasiliensis]